MRLRTRAVALGLAAAGLTLGTVNPASATPAAALRQQPSTTDGSSVPADAAVSPDALTNYQVVSVGPLSVAAHAQGFDSVACPSRTVPLSGGAYTDAFDINVALNSSYPLNNGWAAYLNNDSAASTTLYVYAVCARKPRNYAVVAGAVVTNNAGSQVDASATCPVHTKLTGGGSYSNTGSLLHSINDTWPLSSTSWLTSMNNTDTVAHTVQTFAICAKLRSAIVQSADVANPATSQSYAQANCPVGFVPSGGGVYSSWAYTGVNVNSSYPISGGWRAFESNTTSFAQTMRAYAICTS
jgi:hypothetical protein